MKLLYFLLISVSVLPHYMFARATTKPVNHAPAVDDIRFWSLQFKEHPEMASDFTNDAAIKQEGLQQAAQWQNYRTSGSFDAKEFTRLANLNKSYQNKVYRWINSNKNEKDLDKQIQLDLLDHMNKETDYAIKKASGRPMSAAEEIAFWAEEHKGEAKASAHFSKDEQVRGEAQVVEEDLNNNSGRPENLQLQSVENANKELDKMSKIPGKSRMPKKLAEHEQRERNRAKEIFRRLGAQK